MKFLVDPAFLDTPNLKRPSVGHLALWNIVQSNHKRKKSIKDLILSIQMLSVVPQCNCTLYIMLRVCMARLW